MPRMRAQRSELSVAAVMKEATERAGSDDWGGTEFRHPLDLLLRSCRGVGPLGRQVLHSVVLRHLRNRLEVHRFLRAHPEANGASLSGAIVVTGIPRTGTTLLHNLLALDPDSRFLSLWEALRPVPPQGAAERAERIARAHAWLERFYEQVPAFEAVHRLEAEGPEECDALLQNSFTSQHFDDMFDAPAYSRWLAGAELHDAYAHYALQLRVLTSIGHEGRRWVLKSPSHVGHLDALLTAMPGSLVAHCHRDPLTAVSSYASLMATLRSAYSDEVSAPAVGQQALERCATAIRRALAVRESIGPATFVDVFYDELVRDPIAAVRQVYQRAGRTLEASVEARMLDWVAQNPQAKHGRHRYGPADFGLSEEQVASAFEPYTRRFARLVAA